MTVLICWHGQRLRVMHQLKDFLFHHNVPREISEMVLSWVEFDYAFRQQRALETMALAQVCTCVYVYIRLCASLLCMHGMHACVYVYKST